MRGEQVLGQRNPKRKRWPPPLLTEEDKDMREGGAMREEANLAGEAVREEGINSDAVPTSPVVENADAAPTIPVVENAPPVKKTKLSYDEWSREDLVEEVKRRKMKPGNMGMKRMIEFLEKEDKNQRRIFWTRHDREEDDAQGTTLRGEQREEGEAEGTHNSDREDDEAGWVDITPQEEASSGRESEGIGKPNTSALRRPKSIISPGRPRGKGRKGYWVAKREAQLTEKLKTTRKEDSIVRTDSNSSNPSTNRVKSEAKGGHKRAGN